MDIDISSISLDVENFRHKKVATERDAILAMLTDEKTHKVSDLARDIVELRGLDPSSRLIVMDDASNPGQFIALEGNRRITALKTLINPDLALNLGTHSLFKRLSPDFMKLGISKVDCIVLDRASASAWIKRKHYNAMGGRGVIQWNATATARSEAAEGRPPRWMSALQFIDQQGMPTESLEEGISSKTTTVERVFTSSHMGSILGIGFKDGTITAANGDLIGAANLLCAMLLEMGHPDFTETKVTSAALQKEFIERFEHLNLYKKAPAGGTQGSSPAGSHGRGAAGTQPHGSGNSAGGAQGGSGAQSQPAAGSSAATRSKPVRQRTKLADTGLRISNHALNKLYAELKKLNVETNPHIGAAMVRVFFEKATMVFLEDMAVQCKNPNGWRDFSVKLKDKAAAALHFVDPHKSDPKLQYVWEVANGVQGKLHTLDQLNRAVHDHSALPSATEIVGIWDRYHDYFKVLFETLEKNGK